MEFSDEEMTPGPSSAAAGAGPSNATPPVGGSSGGSRLPVGGGRTIWEVYGVPPEGVLPSDAVVVDLEAEPDTSRDEEIARELFVRLNRQALGIPGDSGLLNILDSEDEDEEEAPKSPIPSPAASVSVMAPTTNAGESSRMGEGEADEAPITSPWKALVKHPEPRSPPPQ